MDVVQYLKKNCPTSNLAKVQEVLFGNVEVRDIKELMC